jgi:hypothetical protein
MKHLLVLYLTLSASIYTSLTSSPNPNASEFLQATERFQRMTVKEIHRLDACSLSKQEMCAFRKLAKSIFSQEVASADCFSQANRRKYEVMYQKIGQFSHIN